MLVTWTNGALGGPPDIINGKRVQQPAAEAVKKSDKESRKKVSSFAIFSGVPPTSLADRTEPVGGSLKRKGSKSSVTHSGIARQQGAIKSPSASSHGSLSGSTSGSLVSRIVCTVAVQRLISSLIYSLPRASSSALSNVTNLSSVGRVAGPSANAEKNCAKKLNKVTAKILASSLEHAEMIDLTKSESEDDTSSKRIDLKATTDSSDDETLHQPKKKEPKSNPSIKLATAPSVEAGELPFATKNGSVGLFVDADALLPTLSSTQRVNTASGVSARVPSAALPATAGSSRALARMDSNSTLQDDQFADDDDVLDFMANLTGRDRLDIRNSLDTTPEASSSRKKLDDPVASTSTFNFSSSFGLGGAGGSTGRIGTPSVKNKSGSSLNPLKYPSWSQRGRSSSKPLKVTPQASLSKPASSTTVKKKRKVRSSVGVKSTTSKKPFIKNDSADIDKAERKEALRKVEKDARKMYEEMDPKDAEVDQMRKDYPRFMEVIEFFVLVMFALSLTTTFAKNMSVLTRWILQEESTRTKFLWRFITNSTAPARQWLVDVSDALAEGRAPPPPPDGLPQLFETVPKDPDLREIMHRPVIYGVTGKPSVAKGPNEEVAKAVKRALGEGFELVVATLLLIYFGIARGAEGFPSRMKGYNQDFRHVESRQAKSLLGSPDSEGQDTDELLGTEPDFHRFCLLILPVGISVGEGALFESFCAMSTGAICVDAMWQNELKVELETESGNAILQKVGGSDGELILRLKEAMVGKSHLRSGVLGMNRINPIAHGIHSKAERSDGQARIRGLIKRYLAPLASPEGLEIGLTSSRELYFPQVTVDALSNAAGSVDVRECITIARERSRLQGRDDIDWKKIEHVRIVQTSSLLASPSTTTKIGPLTRHPLMESLRIYVPSTDTHYLAGDLLTAEGERQLERWILKTERVKFSLADVRYQSYPLDQILPRLIKTANLSEHDTRVQGIIAGLGTGRGIPLGRQLVTKTNPPNATAPAGSLYRLRLAATATKFPISDNLNLGHPNIHALFGNADTIYLDKRGARFWVHDGGSNEFLVDERNRRGELRGPALERIWSGIMTAYEEYLNELNDDEEEDD